MRDLTEISKMLSYVLRHGAKRLGLDIDERGWVSLSEMLSIPHLKAFDVSMEEELKPRFELNEDKTKIRALYGHSIDGIFPDLVEFVPVEGQVAYHGTSDDRWTKIIASKAILPMSRNFVHLTTDVNEALTVADRYAKGGIKVVITIDLYTLSKMHTLYASGPRILARVVPGDACLFANSYVAPKSPPRFISVKTVVNVPGHVSNDVKDT